MVFSFKNVYLIYLHIFVFSLGNIHSYKNCAKVLIQSSCFSVDLPLLWTNSPSDVLKDFYLKFIFGLWLLLLSVSVVLNIFRGMF